MHKKEITMKNVFLTLLSCVVMPLCALGNSADNILVSISMEQGPILPYEPFGVAVIVENQSGNDVERTASTWLTLRIRKDGSDDWQVYMPYGPLPTPMPPQKRILHPGERYQDVCLIHVNAMGRHVFSDPGAFIIQAGTPFGESDPVKISVQLPESEVAASAALGEEKIFMYFSEYTTQALRYRPGYDASKAIDAINAFAGKFPESRYNAWARLGLFFAKQRMFENEDISKGHEMLAEIKNNSTLLPPVPRGHMLISMATLAQKMAAKSEVAWALNEIESTHTNGYFNVLAKYLFQQYGTP